MLMKNVSDGRLQGAEGAECCDEERTGDSQNVCIDMTLQKRVQV